MCLQLFAVKGVVVQSFIHVFSSIVLCCLNCIPYIHVCTMGGVVVVGLSLHT